MPSAVTLIFTRVRVSPATIRPGLVRALTSALALRTSIGTENVVPVVGPVKVSTCLPFLTLPFSLNDDRAPAALVERGRCRRCCRPCVGSRLTSPTLMSSVASLASTGPVMASEDRLSLTSWPIR